MRLLRFQFSLFFLPLLVCVAMGAFSAQGQSSSARKVSPPRVVNAAEKKALKLLLPDKKIIESHSYAVEFSNWGKTLVLVLEEKTHTGKKNFVINIIKEKKVWQSFPDVSQSTPEAHSVAELGFVDMNSDGFEDITFVASYNDGSRVFVYPVVFLNDGKYGFAEDFKMTAALNSGKSLTNVGQVHEYLMHSYRK